MVDNDGDYHKMKLPTWQKLTIAESPPHSSLEKFLAVHYFLILFKDNVQECKRNSSESIYCIPAEMTELDEAKTEDNLQENFHKLERVS